jgi:hypothetical protein
MCLMLIDPYINQGISYHNSPGSISVKASPTIIALNPIYAITRHYMKGMMHYRKGMMHC